MRARMISEKGKIIDFVSGKPVNDTPEEHVRQIFEGKLVEGFSRVLQK